MRKNILALSVVVAAAAMTIPTIASAAPLCPEPWTEVQCMAMGVRASKALKPIPNGQKAKNFAVTPTVAFTCSDGTKAVRVDIANEKGDYTFATWGCPRQNTASK